MTSCSGSGVVGEAAVFSVGFVMLDIHCELSLFLLLSQRRAKGFLSAAFSQLSSSHRMQTEANPLFLVFTVVLL